MKTITLNNETYPWEENLTISKIIKTKKFTFKMLVVKIDGNLVKKDQYSTITIPENADVKIIHLISGG